MLANLSVVIGQTNLWGIPMDIVAHSLVGFIIYVFFRSLRWTHYPALAVVLALGLWKELGIDATAIFLSGLYLEPFKDIFFSVLIPHLFFLFYEKPRLLGTAPKYLP